MQQIIFQPRWKEELVAISEEGKLVFEFTMGIEHVYFPDEKRWKNCVPTWAKDKWKDYLEGCQKWCDENRIPISLVPNAYVYEDKNGRNVV